MTTSPDNGSSRGNGANGDGRRPRRDGRHVRGGGKTSMREDEEWADPLLDRDAARRDRSVWRRTRRAQVLASFRSGAPFSFLPRSGLARILLAITAVFLLLLILTTARAADGFVPVPPYAARVTDKAGMLTAQQRSALEGVLRDYEARSGSQIAVLLVPSTAPEAIEQYGIRVAEAWKLGRKGLDDGVLLLVAKDNPSSLRRLRIEAGRGVQGSLTDAQSKRVLQDVIAPHFRQGDYYGGLAAGVSSIATLIDKEHLPAPAGAAGRPAPPAPDASPGTSATPGVAPAASTPGGAGSATDNAGLGRLADAAGAGAIGGAQPPAQSRAGSDTATSGADAAPAGRNGKASGNATGGDDTRPGDANGRGNAERGAVREGGGFGWLLPLVLIGAGWFLLRGRGRRSGLRRGGWGSDASGVLIGAALGNAISNAGRWGHGGYGGGGFGGGGGGFSGGGGGTFDGGGASGDW